MYTFKSLCGMNKVVPTTTQFTAFCELSPEKVLNFMLTNASCRQLGLLQATRGFENPSQSFFGL